MPEVLVDVRWPDGGQQRFVSPSRAIERTLVAGATYPVAEFLRRATAGLAEASDRVREVHGHPCAVAAAASREVAERAREQSGDVAVTQVRRAPRRPRFPAPEGLAGHVPVLVVGGGQAGLALSACLGERGIEHLVLERSELAHSWKQDRWDAFCLVTPNWQCRLPGFAYPGDDPDGFMVKDAIVDYVEAFADRIDPPLHEGVTVTRVGAHDGGGFVVETSHGELTADAVVLCVGGYHVATVPRLAERLPPAVTQLHSSRYRNPSSLPDGAVLVVGSGQSGAQIAEDLHLDGRAVHLAVGTAPRVARFYRGRDVVAWQHDIGRYDLPITEHPEGDDARREANHYVTGRGGGHDIDLRRFAAEGMALHGRLVGAGEELVFDDTLAANLDAADATFTRINEGIDAWIEEQGIDAPPQAPYVPPWAPAPATGPEAVSLAGAGITSVVWATGFTSDWRFVDLPAFDGSGYPVHLRGVTSVPGLGVLGLPWLHTWGSGRFAGIERDADHLADHVARHVGAPERTAA